MPIIFDEVTADITPPAPTTGSAENETDRAALRPDPLELVRELKLMAERAERLSAD